MNLPLFVVGYLRMSIQIRVNKTDSRFTFVRVVVCFNNHEHPPIFFLVNSLPHLIVATSSREQFSKTSYLQWVTASSSPEQCRAQTCSVLGSTFRLRTDTIDRASPRPSSRQMTVASFRSQLSLQTFFQDPLRNNSTRPSLELTASAK